MRKMNCRMLAAALVAVQIAVTAMPATALAAENDQIQETVQEQVEAPAETTETTETAPAEIEAPVEEPEEVVETQPQEEITAEVTEETEAAEETKTRKTEEDKTEAEEVIENKEKMKVSEEPAEDQAFDQTVTVDNVKIKVTAEAGAFEEGAKLSAARVPSTQLKEVENAVADARAKDELVKSAYAFDVKIMSQDGRALQPAAGKKVKVSFAAEEAVNNSLSAVVYHIVGPKDNIKAQKLATTINREAKAAEAQTTGLSYYVVEFISKVSADENADPDKSAKTETTDDTDKTAKTAKTETTEDTKTTGKTDPVPEDKNSKTETVTPAAKDTAKANTETPAVKKETKTDNKKSEVKKEKKSENKKAETAKKEKKDSKKTEKAKANTKKSPKTSDTSNMVIWITTSLLAVGGIVVLLLFRRRLR